MNPAATSASLRLVQPEPTTTADAAGMVARTDSPLWLGMKPREVIVMVTISIAVLLASYRGWWSIGVAESWGFVTGGICVWLVVREHVWNWPVGLANNIFFFVLFLKGRLFADMSLQIVYLGLGIYGWWNWVFGGQNHTQLRITRAIRLEWWALGFAVPLATLLMRAFLITVHDAAPLWDALTTVLSLAAQYLLCTKRFENWWFWIAADIIYVPLYLVRHLPLTAILYGIFLVMCLIGTREWSVRMRKGAAKS